jgi:replicative DNA helicase
MIFELKMPIYIDDTSAVTLMEIISICRKKKAEENIGSINMMFNTQKEKSIPPFRNNEGQRPLLDLFFLGF